MSSLSHVAVVCSQEVSFDSFPGVLRLTGSEDQRTTIHILDSSATDRASTFRLFADFGYHCEIYSTLAELIDFKPSAGILVVSERKNGKAVADVIKATREAGLTLTVVGSSRNPSIDTVIAAMQAGAHHYFEIPFVAEKIGPVLKNLAEISKAQQKSNEQRTSAIFKLRHLSVRERQVIQLMVEGNSNKSIARLLDISPRTVEIHRMKAMGKLNAQNASEAVRIWLIGNEELK